MIYGMNGSHHAADPPMAEPEKVVPKDMPAAAVKLDQLVKRPWFREASR